MEITLSKDDNKVRKVTSRCQWCLREIPPTLSRHIERGNICGNCNVNCGNAGLGKTDSKKVRDRIRSNRSAHTIETKTMVDMWDYYQGKRRMFTDIYQVERGNHVLKYTIHY